MPRTLVGTPVTDKPNVHDLLLWESNREYCRHAVSVTGPVELAVGDVLVNAAASPETIPAGGYPTFSDSICLENVTIPDGETWSIAALVRGPALVNIDMITPADDDETDAEKVTRLADLKTQLVRFIKEPVVKQTTETNS